MWSTYVAVDDIEAAIASVEAAGGRLVHPVEQAGEGGHNATVADPAGVEIRLWQAKRRLGAQVTNTPGAWNFSDLHAADPVASQAFYEQVFGWVFVGPWSFADDDPGARLRRPPGRHRRSRHPRAPGHAHHPASPTSSAARCRRATSSPHWHVTFTVADRDESASLAESLGATVLGREDTDWTKQATLRDPQGAVFTASQFTPPG